MSGPPGIVVSPPLSDDLELLACAQRVGRADGRHFGGRAARGRSSPPSASTNARPGRTIGRASCWRSAIAASALSKGRPNTAPRRFATTASSMRCATPGSTTSRGPRPAISPFNPGVEAAERLLREQGSVTALACANDDMAAGAMLALHRAGLEIPSAMSVTGFDDTPMSEVVWPPLTTVRQPIKYSRRARGPSAVRDGQAAPASYECVDARADRSRVDGTRPIDFAPLDRGLGFEAPNGSASIAGVEARP